MGRGMKLNAVMWPQRLSTLILVFETRLWLDASLAYLDWCAQGEMHSRTDSSCPTPLKKFVKFLIAITQKDM